MACSSLYPSEYHPEKIIFKKYQSYADVKSHNWRATEIFIEINEISENFANLYLHSANKLIFNCFLSHLLRFERNMKQIFNVNWDILINGRVKKHGSFSDFGQLHKKLYKYKVVFKKEIEKTKKLFKMVQKHVDLYIKIS